MKKTLVAYFSASGVTKQVATDLASLTDSDLFEIKPQTIYTSKDLDWTIKDSRSAIEMKNKDFRPPIIKNGINPENYDTIYLGFPIWWYTSPTIINTFLESYDLTNKTIILFATSGGSNFGKTKEELQVSAKNANFEEGIIFKGQYSKLVLENWLKK